MSTLIIVKRQISYGAFDTISQDGSSVSLSEVKDENLRNERNEELQMTHRKKNDSEEENRESGLLGIVKEAWQSSEQHMAILSTFSTSYNVVNISIVLPIILVYHNNGNVNPKKTGVCASSLLIGMIIGQLVGGWLGDKIGRVRALQTVMLFQLFASLGSAVIVPSDRDINILLDALSSWRFILGIGAGGVYPLAAVISAEAQQNSNHLRENQQKQDKKLRLMSLVFSTQGFAFLCVPLVTYILLNLLGYNQLELVWRIDLGVGAIPSFWMLILSTSFGRKHRVEMDSNERNAELSPLSNLNENETHHHNDELSSKIEVIIDALSASESSIIFLPSEEDTNTIDNSDSITRSSSEEGIWDAIGSDPNVLTKLVGTALAWFLFDLLFYGNTLFEPIVLDAALGYNKRTKHLRSLSTNVVTNLSFQSEEEQMELLLETVMNSLFINTVALPGYILSFLFMGKRVTFFSVCDHTVSLRQTPRNIQCQGFIFMAVLYSIIASGWHTFVESENGICKIWLLVLYGGTFFFANYGPNTTTYLMPSLVFPRKCRSTLNGLSAAAGKTGAVLGACYFAPISESCGDQVVMIICALVSVLGTIITCVCIPFSDEMK